jgi:nucleoside-diphosphate-sugar epimerase
MGGMVYISANHSTILRNNALIDLHTIDAAQQQGVRRVLFTSSACVYPEHLQLRTDIAGLREEDAFPAAPQDAYGWEKLFGELLCRYYYDGVRTPGAIVRFHNIYGPRHLRRRARGSRRGVVPKGGARDDGTRRMWGDGR